MGKQPVLRLDPNAADSQAPDLDCYHSGAESLCAATTSLVDESGVLGNCDFEPLNFDEPLPEFFDGDWGDPSSRIDSFLADGLSCAADVTGFDDSPTFQTMQSSQARDSSSQCPTLDKQSSLLPCSSAFTTHHADATSHLGKETATSKNLEHQQAVSLPSASTPKASLRTSVSAQRSRALHASDTESTYLHLYEETRAAYLKELRRLYDFLVNSYKSAGKTPNSEGRTKLEELRGLIEFFTPRRNELDARRLTADGLSRLRHLRDVARAYIQFYRTMKPPSTSKHTKTTPKSHRDQPSLSLHPQTTLSLQKSHPQLNPLHTAPVHPLHTAPGPNPFSQPCSRSLRVTPLKRDRPSELPTSPTSHPFTHSQSSHYTQTQAYPTLSSSRTDEALSRSLDTDSARSYSLAGSLPRLQTSHPFSPQLSDATDMSAFPHDSPTLSNLSNLSDSGNHSAGNNIRGTASLKLPLAAMSLQDLQSQRRHAQLMTSACITSPGVDSHRSQWRDDTMAMPPQDSTPKHRLAVSGYAEDDHLSLPKHHPQLQPPSQQHHHQHSEFGHSLKLGTSGRPAGLQLPSSIAGSAPALMDPKKRAMLQTATAAAHGYGAPSAPLQLPQHQQQQPVRLQMNKARSRRDALKTMPVLGYGGMGGGADTMLYDDQLGVQLQSAMNAYEGASGRRHKAGGDLDMGLHMLQEEAELLQSSLAGKGLQPSYVEDMDLLQGLVGGGAPSDLQNWSDSLLDDSLQLAAAQTTWQM